MCAKTKNGLFELKESESLEESVFSNTANNPFGNNGASVKYLACARLPYAVCAAVVSESEAAVCRL